MRSVSLAQVFEPHEQLSLSEKSYQNPQLSALWPACFCFIENRHTFSLLIIVVYRKMYLSDVLPWVSFHLYRLSPDFCQIVDIE